MKSLSLITLSLLLAPFASAAVISIPSNHYGPDGTNNSNYMQTDIATPNGGNVLPTGPTTRVAYFITAFSFGTGSDAHLEANFRATGGQPRVGVRVQDTGQVTFIGTGDGTRTSFNFNQDMAGQTVTLLVKAYYDQTNNVTYGKANASDDTLFNVWINPTIASVEGSGQSAGDMQTVWNSATFGFFGTNIQNQNTPSTAGASQIHSTVILTGSDATFANALDLAVVPEPSTTALLGLGGLALILRRRK